MMLFHTSKIDQWVKEGQPDPSSTFHIMALAPKIIA